MISGWALDGSWLLPLQQIATLPDTFITRQVTADPGMFQKVTSVAQGLMTVAVLVLTVALVPAAWSPTSCVASTCEGVTVAITGLNHNWISPIVGAAAPVLPVPTFSTYLTREVMRQDPNSNAICS